MAASAGDPRPAYSSIDSSTTKPRPLQCGHVEENASTRPSDTRLRVISSRPSSEIGNTWVRVLSRARAWRKRLLDRLAVLP